MPSLMVKSFLEFTPEERVALQMLTTNKPGVRSVFRTWLQSPNPQGMYAAIVHDDEAIIGWAVVSLVEGWNAGQVGVFIAAPYRNRGYARAALAALLPEAKRRQPDWPEYIFYERSLSALFAPAIATSGFKDRWVFSDEYDERYRVATGPK